MPYAARFHVVLHEPEIPQNTGNIGRTCVAVQAKLWLVRPLGFRVDDHHVRRAGMDYWQSLDWQAVDNWDELLQQRGAGQGEQFWYLSKHATRSVWEAQFQWGDTLVFGSESRGLPESLRGAHADRCLALPMSPPARSLNLGSAVAATLYEAWRQCHTRPV